MRTTLLLLLPFFADTACAQVMRKARLDFDPPPPVRVYDVGESRKDAPALIISREVVDGWNFLYSQIETTEFALCLEGKRDGASLLITGFRLAHVISSDISHIQYVPCRGETYVGTAHNHPVNDYPGWDPCHHSKMDQRSFGKDERAHVDIVICGRDRFVWVFKDGADPRLWSAPVAQGVRR
jgi:hypothetical protein